LGRGRGTRRRQSGASSGLEVAEVERDDACETGDDTDGEKDPPARPVRAHGRSGRHLVEHRGVEHPVVQAYDPANELDEERPDEHAISGDGRGRGQMRIRVPLDEDANRRRDDVEPGLEHGPKAHPALLAGRAEPREDSGDQSAQEEDDGHDPEPPTSHDQRETGRTRR